MFRFSIIFAIAVLSTSLVAETIHSFRSQGAEFQDVVSMIRENLGESYQIEEHILAADAKYESFEKILLKNPPKYLLLLDNKSLKFGKQFASSGLPQSKGIKGVVTMALNLKDELRNSQKFCGVAFEAPILRIVTQFQLQTKHKITSVLVLYRDIFSDVIREAKQQLAREKVVLNAIKVSDTAGSKELKNLLGKGLKSNDAVWVLADNILMNRKNFQSVWLNLARNAKKPFLCSVKGLASEEIDFCAFSSYPNSEELAAQTANMLQEMVEDGGDPRDLGVDHVYSLDSELSKKVLRRIYDD